MTLSTYVIAEVGVNHNGSVDMARQLIDAAASAGADAVKFQTYRADQIVSAAAPQAAYQAIGTGGTESARAMLRRLELTPDAHLMLAAHCRDAGITMMATPFDLESLRFLVDDLGLQRLKIASGDLTYAQLLHAAAGTELPLVISTGMATLHEVRDAVDLLAHGLLNPGAVPESAASCKGLAATDAGRAALAARAVLLHCTTAYPTPAADVNLLAMDTLRSEFALQVGYSDHTRGLVTAVAAVARGAAVIEKHITLDRTLPGPDHDASLEPRELAQMVAQIRETETLLGRPAKVPTASERPNIDAARRSLVARREIREGEVFTLEDLDAQRPGSGTSPMRVWELVGTVATRTYAAGEVVEA